VTISDRFFQRLVLAAMMAAFFLLVVAGAATVVNVSRNNDYAGLVKHTYIVKAALADYGLYSERIEAVRRGYILLRDDDMARKVKSTLIKMPPLLDQIATLTRDNPSQQQRIRRLRPVAIEHERSVAATFSQIGNNNNAMQAIAAFGIDDSIKTMNALRAVLAEITAAEAKLLVVRDADQATGTLSLYITLGVTGLLIVVIMGGVLAVVLRYTNDLNRTQDALRGLNTGLEGAVADRTAELSRANEEIQRFAYIVSHDLRSPLVNVMGFTAELEAAIPPLTALADRVDAAAPALMDGPARDALADLPEAIGFIRTSTNKMDRLINSILRLSREGRRTLLPGPVDLAALVGSIRDSLQFRLNELGAEIAITTPMAPIVSDRLALEQILSNLIENATKYLKPGRPGRIVVSARREGRRIIIDVADNGRGIAAGDHERIFELFRRSGVQDQPGEGLGLAHVRALSYRLGGVINCISDLGAGAIFRLSIPDVLRVEPREGIAA
jgi:signal transduction histidine kinase